MTYSARQMDYVSDSVILHRWFHISFVIYIEPMKVMDSTGSWLDSNEPIQQCNLKQLLDFQKYTVTAGNYLSLGKKVYIKTLAMPRGFTSSFRA